MVHMLTMRKSSGRSVIVSKICCIESRLLLWHLLKLRLRLGPLLLQRLWWIT